ncbi:MAG: DUF3050 domain-containing protein [Rhodoferax sp.]|nr:DUF3050 domain-containing protein [Rhodoferax sp.]
MTSTDALLLPELRSRLERHPLYASVRTMDDLRCFMEHHVYAVWDFMSLVKFLQGSVAPVSVPWLPTGNARSTLAQRFINEIVLGEETDEGLPDAKGSASFISHFDLYLGAMEEVGADTRPVRAFLKAVEKKGIAAALLKSDIPEPSRRFMATTFGLLDTRKAHLVGAAFAMGREQVIPGMFRSLLADMGISQKRAPLFHYYLERHIHLDDASHGPLSLQLLAQLCGDSVGKKKAADKAARQAIDARLLFWDGVRSCLPSASKKRKP